MWCERHSHAQFPLNHHHPSFLTNLRPLMPRPIPDLSTSKTLNFPTFIPSPTTPNLSSPSGVPLVSTRWNPTPEQIQALEEMYRRGTRTPSAEQIQQIAAKLRRFGKIEGKNVFYWFQNHKARERQKRRRREMELLAAGTTMAHHELGTQLPAGLLNSRRNLESEHLKNLQQPTSLNCTTTSKELGSEKERWRVNECKKIKKKKWCQLELSHSLSPNNFIENNNNNNNNNPQKLAATAHEYQENENPDFEFRLLCSKNDEDDKSATVLELFPVKKKVNDTEIGLISNVVGTTPTPFFEFLPTKI